MIPNVPLGTDAIEMPNTDMDAELVLQYRLHLPTWHLGSRAAGRNQPLKHSFSQFGWMPMSPTLKSGFSPCLCCLQETVCG